MTGFERRELARALARAQAEFKVNPTITAYYMHNGEEFARHRANPWIGFQSAVDKVRDSMQRTAKAFAEFGAALEKSMRGVK